MTKPVDRNDVVRRLVADFGLTYADMAHYAESTEKTVGRWARDETTPTAAVLRRTIRALGADPADYGINELPGRSATPTTDDSPPAWFVQFQQQHFLAVEQINRKLDRLLAKV